MQYLNGEAGSPRHGAIRNADALQRPAPAQATKSDPVRNALLIASVFASVAVGCVALKTLFSNTQDFPAIQVSR